MEKPFTFEGREKIEEIVGEMASEGEDLYERREVKEEMVPLIIFRLSREWFGVEMTNVKEVIKVGSITYLPSSPEYIAGIVNLRGNILSVTDLKAILGLPHEEETDKTRILAMESGDLNTGFLVDEVVEALEIPKTKITSALLTISPEAAKYIKGQFKTEDKLIALLHVQRILEMKV